MTTVLALTSPRVILLAAVRDGRVWRAGRKDYRVDVNESRLVVSKAMRELHNAGWVEPPRPMERMLLWTLTREGRRLLNSEYGVLGGEK